MPRATGVREILVNALTMALGMAKGAIHSRPKSRTMGERPSQQLHNQRK